jgi:3-carboxy-cis,cis-muconate cycloisomerase
MQAALPIRVTDKLAQWDAPLSRHLDRLAEFSPRFLVLQLGGAVGTLDKLGGKSGEVAARVAERLGLALPDHAWHSERDGVVEFADWLSLVSGGLGKLGADVSLMAQSRIGEIALADGGRSSAMPEKSNPVAAEVLVALARYNATLVGGMHQSLVHEQERSGAAWTLEWLILPQMVMTTAASLRTALALCAAITHIGGDR